MSEYEQSSAEPVVVIGAGPVGLAAAAHLVERGITPVVLEAGFGPGAAIREWGHVRVFSPWRFNIDAAARRLLEAEGWSAPNAAHLPTGDELVDDYLKPLAELPRLAPHVHFDTRVVAVARHGIDKTRTVGRDGRPYLVRTRTGAGEYRDVVARAVIDASGTWGKSNPLGAHGLPAPGEAEASSYMAGALPDILGADRERFAGRHALVVGMGHSAANALLALADLAEVAPGTRITWVVRGRSAARLYGGGDADALPERGKLGTRVKQLVADGRLTLIKNFTIDRFEPATDGPLAVVGRSGDEPVKLDVDVVVAATGFRPDVDMLREVRLDLDPAVEAPSQLAPLIDPNFHSCGTVPPHGERVLAHPDEGFYVAGMKSYGRAPTFLMATGYEQVRSIVAAIAGDREAADEVHLELPETGVCSSSPTVEDADGNVTFAEASGGCGTGDEGSSCGTAAAPRGLTTGVLHGYSGEGATLPVVQEAAPAGGCCGGEPATV
ncbi:FAD-dependent oxidoreductase [Stackebrandtia nassauensis]|uniref:FAD dependent oxidoreductase n=1 Tax=Stackebrandtia nassauensis (strain DSM 44728 / CIP 108903 / NRRL B-16338 / NBRC 102104 / LLR-40K-21) TaxID=446470 RepID=D3Q3C9_STANL|nr:FAD-dependent oxidoreductase [Stackebrandtia nassauensis]ADD41970.1 FAD dependent oxidoreductase [Stackebrandtia nassauensis DSM 44728]